MKQTDDSSNKRWFSDQYFDLIVWPDGDGSISRFELCYGKGVNEHAMVWDRQSGFSHVRVDDGERVLGRHKMTPIFVADGRFGGDSIAARFFAAGKDIDRKIVNFVYAKLKDYSDNSTAG